MLKVRAMTTEDRSFVDILAFVQTTWWISKPPQPCSAARYPRWPSERASIWSLILRASGSRREPYPISIAATLLWRLNS